jgi:2-desacetyl-2-hydroxyethyl bacteriochlorophyllide A dehydrogenase
VNALVYLGPGRMELREAPDPAPEPGDVVIRTRAAAICGSDLHGFREATPRRIPPLVMGHETVGVIDSVGAGVDASRTGTRVVLKPILPCGTCARCREGRTNICANGRLVGKDLAGGFAERFAVPAGAAVPAPPAVSDELATMTEPVANAVHVASRSVRGGDDVLVLGAGPIGVSLVRMAVVAGARRVFSVDPLPSRRRLAEAQGAIALGAEDAGAEALEATSGSGVDVVIDAAGYEATWTLALRTVRAGGRIEAVGLGDGRGAIDFYAVAGKEVTITGSFAWTDEDFARAGDLLAAGELRTDGWFSHVPLADGQRAFEELVGGSERFKVILDP